MGYTNWICLVCLWLVLTPFGVHAQNLDRSATEEDTKILRRAAEILADHSSWNQFDDRECADDDRDKKWSLFCALTKASIEVAGSYEHRRPSLQQVRLVIAELTGKRFAHPIRDYNNHPETGLNDIRQVLAIAFNRVRNQLKDPGSK